MDDVIFQVTQLHHHHELFSASVRERYDTWDTGTKMGELFVEAVSSSFMTNFVLFVILLWFLCVSKSF